MLQEGYRMVVDPDNTIAELNDENNSYDVSNVRLKVWWCNTCIPVYHSTRDSDTINLVVDKVRGDEYEHKFIVLNTDNTPEGNRWIVWDCGATSFYCREGSSVFTILRDEQLEVWAQAFQVYGPDHGRLS